MRSAQTTDRRADVRREAARGFTLVELLTVMTVIAVVFGLAVGSMARSGKAGALEGAARVARSHLMRARMLALSEGALSRVTFRTSEPEKNVRATVETEFTRVAGTWHFDDAGASKTLSGEGIYAKVSGAIPVMDGSLRGGMEMIGLSRVSSPPVEEAPTYDPRRGFAVFADVLPKSGGTIARFVDAQGGQDAFLLGVDDDGAVYAEIGVVFDPVVEAQQKKDRRLKLRTAPGVVEKLQWARIGLSYDGVTAELHVHGVVEAALPETRDVETPAGGALVFGGFTGVLDEAEYLTTSAPEVKEFEAGVDVESKTPIVVRFDRDGRLNERFHQDAVAVPLELEGKRAAVIVDPSGIIR